MWQAKVSRHFCLPHRDEEEEAAVSYSDAARVIKTHHILAVLTNLHHGARVVPVFSALVLYGHAVTHLQSVERRDR